MLRRPIFFIIIVLFLLISLGWVIFSIPWGGSDSSKSGVNSSENKQLVEYSDTDKRVRLNQNGAIVNDKNHREIWITVGRGEIVAEVKQGYEGTTIKSKRYNNSSASYRVFLSALSVQGFDKARDYKGTDTESGSCPSGSRYIYELFDSKEVILHSWSTSCSGKVGTFAGKRDDVKRLFQAQVPDYKDFSRDVDLY